MSEEPDPRPDLDISIRVLSGKTKNEISDLLNPIKVIPTFCEKCLPRYWRGLAALCEIKSVSLPSISGDRNPTDRVLNIWLEQDPKNSTVNKLFEYLELLDRFDVIDDVKELVYEDIRRNDVLDTQIDNKLDLGYDNRVLTRDDVARISEGKPLLIYDALVLFDDSDIGFATEVINTMENTYGMKFLVKERDLAGGGLELEQMIKLLTKRCNRVIVILSDEFLASNSAENKFYMSFAQALGIDENARKLIPCIYKPCKLPQEINVFTKLDYNRVTMLGGRFWDILRDTIRVPTAPGLNRAKSDSNPIAKPALQMETSIKSLKPINQVKFNSMVNLKANDTEETIDSLGVRTSISSLSISKDNVEVGAKAKSKGIRKVLKIFKPKSKSKRNKMEAIAISN